MVVRRFADESSASCLSKTFPSFESSPLLAGSPPAWQVPFFPASRVEEALGTRRLQKLRGRGLGWRRGGGRGGRSCVPRARNSFCTRDGVPGPGPGVRLVTSINTRKSDRDSHNKDGFI
eukprot:767263-Hanusia_phi.AAC.8